MGGKTRSIAAQLILQQCYKADCMSLLPFYLALTFLGRYTVMVVLNTASMERQTGQTG